MVAEPPFARSRQRVPERGGPNSILSDGRPRRFQPAMPPHSGFVPERPACSSSGVPPFRTGSVGCALRVQQRWRQLPGIRFRVVQHSAARVGRTAAPLTGLLSCVPTQEENSGLCSQSPGYPLQPVRPAGRRNRKWLVILHSAAATGFRQGQVRGRCRRLEPAESRPSVSSPRQKLSRGLPHSRMDRPGRQPACPETDPVTSPSVPVSVGTGTTGSPLGFPLRSVTRLSLPHRRHHRPMKQQESETATTACP